jgi:Domain of unknown function (DUF1707)
MTGPGDEIAAGRGHFRASHADREQVVDVLKAAFVQGRLTKDEFDARIGQTFASRTYTQLAAVTADVPAGPVGAHPSRKPVPARARPPMRTWVKATICAVIAVVAMVAAAFAIGGFALALFVPFYLMALIVAGAQVLASRHQKRSRRQLPPRQAPGPGAHLAVARVVLGVDVFHAQWPDRRYLGDVLTGSCPARSAHRGLLLIPRDTGSAYQAA